MKKLSLVLMLCLASTTSFAARRKTYPMNVPALGVQAIVFDVQEGDFVLRGDPAATEVRMNVSIDRTFIFKLGEEGILKRLIKISGQGTPELTIRTDIPRAVTNWGRAEYPIDFEIVVPAAARLALRDTSGVIEISGMNGDVDITDSSGTLAASHLGGALRIRKESGDIVVEEVAGSTTLESRSGQMKLHRLARLDVHSSDGNIDAAELASADIHNKGGNVTVTQVAGDLILDDDSGEIVVSHVRGTVTLRDTSGQIRTSHTGEVEISDTSGNVVVEDAAGLRVLSKESGEVTARRIGGQVEVAAGVKLKRD